MIFVHSFVLFRMDLIHSRPKIAASSNTAVIFVVVKHFSLKLCAKMFWILEGLPRTKSNLFA